MEIQVADFKISYSPIGRKVIIGTTDVTNYLSNTELSLIVLRHMIEDFEIQVPDFVQDEIIRGSDQALIEVIFKAGKNNKLN